MHSYALLLTENHNRVYYEESKKLAKAELEIAVNMISTKCYDIEGEVIGGVYYVVFKAENLLSDDDLRIISNLSFVYAIYQREEKNDNIYFLPVLKNNESFIDKDISSILKYSGKTNETFTRMMINVALFNYKSKNDEKIKLLDPICGKGTSLFEGLTMGLDVYGVEINKKAVNESYHYLKKYLETKRYKHIARIEKYNRKQNSYIKHCFDISKTKEEFKNKQYTKCEMVFGDSSILDEYYKNDFFNIIVGDLPYGVQHANLNNQQVSRSPKLLLLDCLPSWKKVLRKNGVIVLAWNQHVLDRNTIVDIFEKSGFEVEDIGVYLNFIHRVDNAIKRDIIVAKKYSI